MSKPARGAKTRTGAEPVSAPVQTGAPASNRRFKAYSRGSDASAKAGSPADAARKGDLARIHCLKRDLGIDTDTYRDLLWTLARVNSAAELDTHGRGQVIQHMQRLLPASKQRTYPGRPHNADTDNRAELLKIEALLTDADKPWAYAEAMLKHMTRGRKLKMEFASGPERAAIITALHKAAVKRLSAELLQRFGECWAELAGMIASALFGFDATHCRIESYPEYLSKVSRWSRGELAVVCQWPPVDYRQCCGICAMRGGISP